MKSKIQEKLLQIWNLMLQLLEKKVNIIYVIIINLGVGKTTLFNFLKNKYNNNNNLGISFILGKQSSFISDINDDSFDCLRLFFLINSPNCKEQQLIICLRLYYSDFTPNFFITPQAILLLYDITSKESLDSTIKYYNDLIQGKKFTNVKFILVGNKCDLIGEKIEENKENNKENGKEDKIEENKENKKEDKIEENKENKKEDKIEENKVNEKYKEDEKNERKEKEKSEENLENEKIKSDGTSQRQKELEINNHLFNKEIIDKQSFTFTKEISGLNGFYLEDLLNETALLLFSLVKDKETAINDLYQIEGDSIFIENKLEIDNRQKSYHDLEYKKEINKINKSNNKNCCFMCGIF